MDNRIRFVGQFAVMLLCVVVLGGGATLSQVSAQDSPEYQFLLRISDESLFRLDYSDGACVTISIPLPLTEECPYYLPMAPTPDGQQIVLRLVCYGSNLPQYVYLIDLQGNILVEYIPESDEADSVWFAALSFAQWSPDGSFVVLSQATGPGSFALAFYEPGKGFTDEVRLGTEFTSFSPDGTRMLFMTPYNFTFWQEVAASAEPAVAWVDSVADVHDIRGTGKHSTMMILSEWQMWNGDWIARGWLSDDEVLLEDRKTERQYSVNLDTHEMTLFDPAENTRPYPYNGGIQVERSGNVITIRDTNTATVLDEMTFALPEYASGIDLATHDYVWLLWLNPPSP